MCAGTPEHVMDLGDPEFDFLWLHAPYGHLSNNDGELGPSVISILVGGHHGIFHLLRSQEDQRYQSESTDYWIQCGQIGGCVVPPSDPLIRGLHKVPCIFTTPCTRRNILCMDCKRHNVFLCVATCCSLTLFSIKNTTRRTCTLAPKSHFISW